MKLPENGAKYGYNATGVKDTVIERYTFNSNPMLISIVLPDGILTIEEEAFAYSENLESITLPDGLKTIGWAILHNCPITEIHLPASLSSIGPEALGLWSLQRASYGGTVAQWNELLSEWKDTDYGYVFYGCPEFVLTCSDGNITIPAEARFNTVNQ